MVDASTVYAGGKEGRLLRSNDGGRTWSTQDIYCSMCPGVLDIADIDMLDASSGWAATSIGLLQTTDGKTWFDRWTGLHEPAQVQFLSPTEGWIVTSPWGAGEFVGQHGAVVARTVDGGSTWAPVASPLDTQAICFASTQHGFLVTRDEIYLTSDGGSSWQRTFAAPFDAPAENSVASLGCTAQGGVWAQFVGPTGSHLYSSSTDGATWNEVPASAGPSAIAPFGLSDAQLVSVHDGFITFQAVHNGTEVGPETQVTPYRDVAQLDPTALSFADPLHGVLVGDTDSRRPAVFRTDDGGATWAAVTATEPAHVYEGNCAFGTTMEDFNPERGRYTVMLTGIDAASRTLQFDPVAHLMGADAEAAYEADNPGASDTPGDGGYNRDRSTETYAATVAPDVHVRLVRLHETGVADLKPGSFDELPVYLSDPLYKVPGTNRLSGFVYWLSIADAQVVDICEQYHP
jgi:photosystem II stability/assembly factor-like uncharacterized protein